MASVRATKPCFIGQFREAGEVFDYEGPPAAWLVPVDSSGEPVTEPAPATVAAPPRAAETPTTHPLDHDGDGKKGGSKPPRAKKPEDPERAAVIAALKAAKIKFFAGSDTKKLKSLLPG